MKTQKHYVAAMALVIAALTLVPNAFAQSSRLRAEIPFNFYINDQLMPAGTYVVSTLQGGQVIQLSSLNRGHTSVYAMADPAQNRLLTANRLVFNRYGELNFLTQLHWAGQSSGREVRATRLELEAQNGKPPIRVAVVPK